MTRDMDLLDKVFSDIEEFYPGSKRKRKEKITPAARVIEVDWNRPATSKTLPNGMKVDMYTIGALSDALGRPIVTLRSWMKEGYVPTSPYRLPTKKDKNGVERKGRRLYTRPMIEAAVAEFSAVGLLNVKRIEWPIHQDLYLKILDSWNRMRDKDLGATNNNDAIGDANASK